MADTIQVKSLTLSKDGGHENILTVLNNPKQYGLPNGANNKVLIFTMLGKYAEELIKKYGSGSDGGSGDEATHTHDDDDGSEDAMMMLSR